MDITFRHKSVVKVLAIAVFFFCGLSQTSGASVDYGDFSGTMVDFSGVNETTNSIGDPPALFETPIHKEGWDQLLFFPSAFSAASSGPDSDTTTGTLRMTITAKSGTPIERVIIEEFGDYSMTGASGTAEAKFNGTLLVTPTSGPPIPAIDYQGDVFTFPGDSAGPFSSRWEADLTALGFPVFEAELTFDNLLQASSALGTDAFIQKKLTNGPAIRLSVNNDPVVPVPAAIWLLGSGLLGIWPIAKRRRWHTQ